VGKSGLGKASAAEVKAAVEKALAGLDRLAVALEIAG
jgi:hypothetical protein